METKQSGIISNLEKLRKDAEEIIKKKNASEKTTVADSLSFVRFSHL